MTLTAVAARLGVRAIDAALRHHYRIFAFSDDPACILKIGPAVCSRDMTLCDGTHLVRGEAILELHLWNERLPPFPPAGPMVAWSVQMLRRWRYSLGLLAAYLAHASRWDNVQALHGTVGFLEMEHAGEMRTLVEHLGFEFIVGETPGWKIWRPAFWQNLFSWWLMWAFNPASLTHKRIRDLARGELWISRAALMQLHQAA